MIRQFTELPQIVDDDRISADNQRLQWNLSVREVVLLAMNAAHQSHLCRQVGERLTLAAAPRAQEVVSEGRVDVQPVPDVGQVAVACHKDELSVIPVVDDGAVSLTLHDVARQLVEQSRQQ